MCVPVSSFPWCRTFRQSTASWGRLGAGVGNFRQSTESSRSVGGGLANLRQPTESSWRSIGPARRCDGFRATPVPGRPTRRGIGRHLRRTAHTFDERQTPQPSTAASEPRRSRHDHPGAEGLEHSQTVHQEGGPLVRSRRQRPGRSPVPTHLPRHLRRRRRRDHRRSSGPSCAAGRPGGLLCQPPHGRAAVGWMDATDLRDPPQLADQVNAVRTARCRGARGRPGPHDSTATRSDRQPTDAGVLGTRVHTPEPGRSGGRGRLVGDCRRVVSDGSGHGS